MEYKTNNMNLVWCHYKFTSDAFKCEIATMFGGDDAVNLTSELHDPNAQVNHLHKRRKQKDLAEGIGVVPAKYPLKVKLEIFSQL